MKICYILIILLTLCLVHSVWAEDELCIRAAIGEASNQGYHGLLTICVAIRNRGSLDGVYGINSPHIDREPEWVWKMARKAWKESEHNRFHEGTHWENIKEFGEPYWVDSMIEVYRYKDHVFYKEKQRRCYEK